MSLVPIFLMNRPECVGMTQIRVIHPVGRAAS
jgi:hypothetical protein